MIVNKYTFDNIHTPMYVLEEELLRRNLSLIKSVADRANVEIILAFKAYALWKTFPIFREYISSTTASSLKDVCPTLAMTMTMKSFDVGRQCLWKFIGSNAKTCAWCTWIIQICTNLAILRVYTNSYGNVWISNLGNIVKTFILRKRIESEMT